MNFLEKGMKEEMDVKNIQQFHVNNSKVIHDFDLNKLPDASEDIDMVGIVQSIHIDYFNVKHEFNLDKHPKTKKEVDEVGSVQPTGNVTHTFDLNKLLDDDDDDEERYLNKDVK